jgi:glucokinase
MENDVRTAALGVYRFDNEAGMENLIYVGLGTGVAAGIILNGQLYRGNHEMAGEIGHIIVEPAGPRCKCGQRGCLETLVAGPAIAALGQQAARTQASSLLSHEPAISAKTVYQAAQLGDPAALGLTHRVGRYLGRALQSLVMTFDIEQIVLGGGVARAGEAFLQPILQEWARQRQESILAQDMLRDEVLRLADPERNMGAWGAVALAAQAL